MNARINSINSFSILQCIVDSTVLLALLMKGELGHIHFAVVDRVLPASGRDHPSDEPSRPVAGQIRSLHHDTRYFQVT